MKATATPTALRGDIQALRALAVLMVLGVHLWPERLPGGFAGVDVFFAISGFLITSHLLKEILSTGTVQLGRFYARRVRRLLPAAFLVLVVSLAGVVALMPSNLWGPNGVEAAAAAGYVQNLWLTWQAVDYHAQGQTATIAQHYWSLSVEEQFYLLWPALLLLLRGRDPERVRGRLAVAVAVVAGLFLAFSVWFTAVDVHRAYFFTPVRFWEFAAGGLLALGAQRIGRWDRPAGRAAMSAAGWLMLGASCVLLQPTDPFPGWRALLPVVGTALVIAAGTAGAVPWVSRVTDLPLVRLLGDLSYSLYLWHWPLLVLFPHAFGRPPLWPEKLGLMALTFALAWATKRFVEDPGRALPWTTRRTMTVMLVAVLALAGTGVGLRQAGRMVEHAQLEAHRVFLQSPCAGPKALLDPACAGHIGDPLETRSLGEDAKYFTAPPSCTLLQDEKDSLPPVVECDHSQGRADAPLVYLVGDSHAEQWRWAVDEVARRQGWKLRTLVKGGCPIGDLTLTIDDTPRVRGCEATRDAVDAHIGRVRPDMVVTSTYAIGEPVEFGSGLTREQAYAKGMGSMWKRWTAGGTRVSVITDTPLNKAVRPVECVSTNWRNPSECDRPRADAIPMAPLDRAVEAADDPMIRLADMTPGFCSPTTCHAAVGGVQVFYDHDHVQREYTLLLADLLETELTR
ncbi:acyltransferase [Schaalia sp. 19OD2882]|uniref:acyltransferase family protein n=1 Tax=Schaalia sp. 19OD2882 TaxID=2794089 RepID=UPI001C1EBDDE|nr:acyltransferase family protein [Schaalia sp. 19OD2882]QWW20285.1 acyltransferase [Schaalia sp. 19OD2882]